MNSLTCQSKKKNFFLGHIKPPAHVLTEINASPINTAAAVANIAAVAVAATNGRKRTRESNDELLMVSI